MSAEGARLPSIMATMDADASIRWWWRFHHGRSRRPAGFRSRSRSRQPIQCAPAAGRRCRICRGGRRCRALAISELTSEGPAGSTGTPCGMPSPIEPLGSYRTARGEAGASVAMQLKPSSKSAGPCRRNASAGAREADRASSSGRFRPSPRRLASCRATRRSPLRAVRVPAAPARLRAS
jgi:hypothetical protein